MRAHLRNASCFLGISGLLAGVLAAGQVTAAAAAPVPASRQSAHVCAGTRKSPGTLAGGTYYRVAIRGVCEVNAGPVRVRHDLIVARGSALLAIFGRNDHTHGGHSRLTVGGSLIVQRGGTLAMGCESKILFTFGRPSAVFACADDPNQTKPTLSSHDTVGGNLIAYRPLGVVVHNSTIRGGVRETGGGGVVGCAVKGIFTLFKSPVFSDYEDNTIGHSLTVIGLRSCWYGALRNHVHRNMTSSANMLADPDGNEVNSNTVHRSLVCRRNRPAIQYGDGDGFPNRVGRHARGQCGFGVILPDPAPDAHLPVKVKYKHISVRWRLSGLATADQPGPGPLTSPSPAR
jgi:hypothetical protein